MSRVNNDCCGGLLLPSDIATLHMRVRGASEDGAEATQAGTTCPGPLYPQSMLSRRAAAGPGRWTSTSTKAQGGVMSASSHFNCPSALVGSAVTAPPARRLCNGAQGAVRSRQFLR